MEAKILLMNDMHISTDKISDFVKNWNEALDICEEHKILDLVIGGDIWTSRAGQSLGVLMAVRTCILNTTKKGIHLTIAEGNHCKEDLESVIGYSHLFSEYQDVDVVDDWMLLEYPQFNFYVMSYFPENGSFPDRIAELLESEGKEHNAGSDILYIHEGVAGGLITPAPHELPAEVVKDFKYVLVGHYHDRKKIPNTNVQYIGASRQHSFGEDEEKGYTIVYEDGSQKFIKNEVNTRYQTIEVESDQINGKLFDLLGEYNASGKYKTRIRVNCSDNEVLAIDKQKIIDAGASKVEIITASRKAEIKSLDMGFKFDRDGIKKEYVKFCSDKSIKDIDFGIKYIDQIKAI